MKLYALSLRRARVQFGSGTMVCYEWYGFNGLKYTLIHAYEEQSENFKQYGWSDGVTVSVSGQLMTKQ